MSETQPYIDTPNDFLLDGNDDLDISDGDLHWSSGVAGVVEAVDGAIRLALGEWFLEDTAGVDWWGKIMVKNPNLLVVNQLIRTAILSVPYVSEVLTLTVSFDTVARDLSVTWRAQSDFGVVQSVTAVLEQ